MRWKRSLVRSVLTFLLAGSVLGCSSGGNGEATKIPGGTLPPVLPEFTTPFEPLQGAGGVIPRLIAKLSAPTHVAFPPGDPGLMIVTEKKGRVMAVRDGRVLAKPFLDLTSLVGVPSYEQGALSTAFPPDYQRSGLFYVFFTGPKDKLHVEEYKRSRRSRDVADPSSRRLVLLGDHPTAPPGSREQKEHNGGQLQFGPDGMLYISMGDGGPQGDPSNRAQDRGQILGKILRIDPRSSGKDAYRIPPGNPFAAEAGARPEVWTYGLRNPYRFSFDRETGDMYIGDVGGTIAEEVNLLPAGRSGVNFGWKCFEGTTRYSACNPSNYSAPLIERAGGKFTKTPVALIGGYVVRDPRLAVLVGSYLYAEFFTGEISVAVVRNGRLIERRPLGLRIHRMSSFGEDAQGRIYTVSLFTGLVHRLDPAG